MATTCDKIFLGDAVGCLKRFYHIIKKAPLLRKTEDMSCNIECELLIIKWIKSSQDFAMQADKSTNVAAFYVLLAHVRYI
jgi:hypothetical protein